MVTDLYIYCSETYDDSFGHEGTNRRRPRCSSGGPIGDPYKYEEPKKPEEPELEDKDYYYNIYEDDPKKERRRKNGDDKKDTKQSSENGLNKFFPLGIILLLLLSQN